MSFRGRNKAILVGDIEGAILCLSEAFMLRRWFKESNRSILHILLQVCSRGSMETQGWLRSKGMPWFVEEVYDNGNEDSESVLPRAEG